MSTTRDTTITRRKMLGLATAAGLGALVPRRLLGSAWDDRLADLATLSAGGSAPFRMAAIGDSVMWGQGLLHEQKFAPLVQQWLGSPGQLGRPVELQFLARSGANIEKDGGDSTAPRFNAVPYFYWEAPGDSPSVTEQARRIAYRDTVDLVIVTAGANDFGFLRLLSPAMTPAVIEAEAARLIGTRMFELLDRMISGRDMEKLPRARIVVTGYYKALSEKSDGVVILDLVRSLAGASAPFLQTLADFYGMTGKAVLEMFKVALCLGTAFRTMLLDNSAAMLSASNKALRSAVDRINAKYPAANGPRVEFVPAPFADDNAMGAPNSFIWNALEVDPVQSQRMGFCASGLKDVTGLGSWIQCNNAATLHPNVKGARAYFEAITTRLTQTYLPIWKSETTA